MPNYLFSSESVTEGHPDKMADQISDAILDEVIKDDVFGRVACETFLTTGLVLVGGEITTDTYVDIPKTVREVVKDIGYVNAEYGFDYMTCAVMTSIDQQSPDIAMGVDRAGAGDQGMMFGYATTETAELMPMPILLAHKITHRLADVRKSGKLPFLRPDGKAQVTIRYENDKPIAVEKVVVSAQHEPNVAYETLKEAIIEEVVKPVLPQEMVNGREITYFINPTGRFVIGGPQGDAGLTGRKIIVDTYGGVFSHGGGAFSGKDPTKVDRSASYFARYVAKNVVAAGLAEKCGVQVAYAIGVAEPVSLMVQTFGTGKMPDEELTKLVQKHFDFTPGGIIETLDLRRPIYRKTAAYGHFGREMKEFTWEKTDMAETLKKG
ncbi:methionine adenosyltransferase [Caldithrix abyssi]|uniref:S-adenosylmethionine synthase n=1 Tax=Caldithrix abyssi DSM 13497 TaxID=880073 RepID=H1XXY7_CALAY|nr:methionine adenosyltransferase [Caldithrix abyssi]APF20637.1 metK methionine adenosyltransferase [Caldithrix abyssi DSM 13497]EHO40862.1 S-adenosylmethionine synthase [Caldithrix abyssi DSM 13497]